MKALSRRWPILGALSACLLLMGAGCDGGIIAKVRSHLPKDLPFGTVETYDLRVGEGARLTVRPSVLGISGSVQDLIGGGSSREVTVTAFDDAHLALAWHDASGTSTPASGTVVSAPWASAHATLPPAFWQSGTTTAANNSLIWLSPASYAELTGSASATEWQPSFFASGSLPALAVKALEAFKTVAAQLAPLVGGSATSTSSFGLAKTADIASYPLRINGSLERVAAVRASGAFADLIILKNPETPLVLNVTLKPGSLTALKALAPFGIDAAGFGYEVTEVDTKRD